MSDDVRYVARDTTPLFELDNRGRRRLVHELLWGDRVRVLEEGADRWRARARGFEGYVDPAALGDVPLLEVYFIDVGQGDGVLIRCPDDRHVLVDGGYNRAKQPSGKNAADFVDWKFFKDYEQSTIALDAMISSHCDADHYGGLWDLLNPEAHDELDATKVKVKAFYHAGVSWWTDDGKRSLGPADGGFLTRLLEDEDSVDAGLSAGSTERLQGEWAEFLARVRGARCPVRRLSDRREHVPKFTRNDVADGKVALRVLGPVEPEPGRLYDLGNDSQNTNGNSILLRLDYGRVRILLTGDLNQASQRRLLEAYTGRRMEFACDVAKGCHHGSADVSYEFLSTMAPAATVISSGDSEQHAHPRPSIVAASALTGHVRVDKDALVTPLIFSTEISRSVRMGKITHLEALGVGLDHGRLDGDAEAEIHYAEIGAGDLKAKRGSRALAGAYVVAGLIYGLVNVRTDGERILCATLNEKNRTWDCQGFRSRF
jgi:beta-lactamase superfamily II metal-dependent hydrolase